MKYNLRTRNCKDADEVYTEDIVFINISPELKVDWIGDLGNYITITFVEGTRFVYKNGEVKPAPDIAKQIINIVEESLTYEGRGEDMIAYVDKKDEAIVKKKIRKILEE